MEDFGMSLPLGMGTREACADMRRRDPDGWETREPTDADRTAFRDWAIEAHGFGVWLFYMRTDWDHPDYA